MENGVSTMDGVHCGVRTGRSLSTHTRVRITQDSVGGVVAVICWEETMSC